MKRKIPSKFNITKEQVYTVIIFLLIVFWTVSSVLGIIGFARSFDSNENVVSAKAETSYDATAYERVYAILPSGTNITTLSFDSNFDPSRAFGYISVEDYHGVYYDQGQIFYSPLVCSYSGQFIPDVPQGYDTIYFSTAPKPTAVGQRFQVRRDFWLRVLYQDFFYELGRASTIFLHLTDGVYSATFTIDPTVFQYRYVSHDQSYDEGYDDGYLQGIEGAKYGVFNYFDYNITLYEGLDYLEDYDGVALGPNRVSFGPVYEHFIAEGYDSGSVEISFDTAHDVTQQVSLRSLDLVFYGDKSSMEGLTVTTKGFDYYTLQPFTWYGTLQPFEGNSQGLKLVIDYPENDPYIPNPSILSLSFTLPYLSDLKLLEIVGSTALYSQGYDVGFAEGNNAGYYNGFEMGYDKGYGDGFPDGKDVGYYDGVADAGDYSFFSLISSLIDAPIQAFTGLFNFEVLGVNLASFFFALLSVCVVLTIVKMVI